MDIFKKIKMRLKIRRMEKKMFEMVFKNFSDDELGPVGIRKKRKFIKNQR